MIIPVLTVLHHRLWAACTRLRMTMPSTGSAGVSGTFRSAIGFASADVSFLASTASAAATGAEGSAGCAVGIGGDLRSALGLTFATCFLTLGTEDRCATGCRAGFFGDFPTHRPSVLMITTNLTFSFLVHAVGANCFSDTGIHGDPGIYVADKLYNVSLVYIKYSYTAHRYSVTRADPVVEFSDRKVLSFSDDAA